MLKKYWKIIVVVVFVIALAIAGYFLEQYLTASNNPAVSPNGNQNQNSAPNSSSTDLSQNKETIKKESEQQVFDFIFTGTSSNDIIYLTPEGRVYRLSDGEDQKLSDQTLSALNKISASPSQQKILAAFGDPSQPKWLIFDLIDKAWRPLPNNIIEAIWGQNDNEIIAIVQENNLKNLTRIKINQTPAASEIILRNFLFNDISLILAAPQTLLIAEKPASFYAGRAWQLNLKTSELSLVFGPSQGLYLKQTADRSHILKFDSTNHLSVSDQNDISYQTLPEKCDSSGQSLYCFIPLSWADDKNWPDDYLQKNLYTEDQLFILDDQGQKTISLGGQKIDGLKPTIIKDSLYFLNRRDNNLYKIESVVKATTPTSF